MITTMIMGITMLLAYVVAAGIKLGHVPHSLTELATAFAWPLRVLWFVSVWGCIILSAPALIQKAVGDTQYLVYIALASALVYTIGVQMSEEVDRKIATAAGWLCVATIVVFLIFNV